MVVIVGLKNYYSGLRKAVYDEKSKKGCLTHSADICNRLHIFTILLLKVSSSMARSSVNEVIKYEMSIQKKGTG